MDEINIKIQELSDDISEIEIKCCKLVNYGNVPKENWNILYKLIQERSLKVEVLNELIDLKDIITSNKSSK